MNKVFTSFIILSFFTFSNSFSQNKYTRLKSEVKPPVCYGSGKVEKSYTPPPPDILLKSAAEKTADIVVDYSLFPEDAINAFEFAVNIWEHIIQSDIPIYMQADWRTLDNSVLGSAGPTGYYTDFQYIPHEKRYYPVALVERITKEEITGSYSPDISSAFNKSINWYFGTDGETPDSLYDFVTVALHEIAHGLGFTGFFYIDNNKGTYAFEEEGDASAFDLLVVDNKNNQLVDTSFYQAPSAELKNAFTSVSLYANSPTAVHCNHGTQPKLYAPRVFDDGSSLYHLNESTHPGNLMTHAIGKGEAMHDPGKLVSGIIGDLGWKHMFIDFKQPKDMEQIEPITFDVFIESDYKLESDSLFVIFSTDDFLEHKDSLQITATQTPNKYSVEFTPDSGVEKITYYIHAMDTVNRIFTLPTEAPKELYTIKIGPDTESPEIVHDPIPYFLLTNNDLEVSAFVDDNLGIDTVFVEYEINGVIQTPFGLTADSSSTYSGYFNFSLAELKDGDKVSYNITARDASNAQNSKKIPFKDVFEFNVEQVFEPVERYWNTFNEPTVDFVISDFDIYTETNFDNAALQSPHPYSSPEQIKTNFNFSTILKRPIILNEGATMSFDEVVLVEPGEVLSDFGDDDYWDYVIVEGSLDTGKTWISFDDGYDSGAYNIWKNNYNQNLSGQNSTTIGTKEWYINREIDLLANENFSAGDTVLIRFRLFSDPFANGWGWTVDNLKIQIPVSSKNIILSPGNISIFPNPFKEEFRVSLQVASEINKLELIVFNSYGRKVFSSNLRNQTGKVTETINLQSNASGMYFISIKENGKTLQTRKIIKQ